MNLSEKRILIVRLGAIGDVIRTLPALRALRANLPEAYISWAVEDGAASLIRNHPDLDDILLVPRKRWGENKWTWETVREIGGVIQCLRQKAFDVALDFHGLFKSGIITYLSGAPDRIGFGRGFSKEGNFLFTNHHVALPARKLNRIERNLHLIRSLGLEVNGHDPIIPVEPEDREYADRVVSAPEKSEERRCIIMHPGSSPRTVYKRWGYRRFAQLADILIRNYGARIIFTAGNDERELIHRITREMKESQYAVCETRTLTQLAEILRRCALYIGNDTAPMHLAAFVGTPVIALFGPTDPIENAPYHKNVSFVIRKDVFCNPCRNRDCRNLLCMDAIEVEDVLEPVHRVLSDQGFPPPHNASPASCMP